MSLFNCFYKFYLFFLLSFFIFVVEPTLMAQGTQNDSTSVENTRSLSGRYQGDLGLQLNGFLWVPLFNIDPQNGIRDTNLSAGGGIDITFIYYLTPGLGIGGFLDIGLSGPANQSASIQDYFLAILLGPRLSYDFNIYTIRNASSHPIISFPIGVGLAVSAVKFGDITNIIPVLKFDAGIYFNPFNQPEWAFGMSLHYWFAPEFTKTELSRIGNYLMIGIGFNFHSGL